MAKAIAIVNMTDEQLTIALAEANRKIDAGRIEWTNASNEARTCPFGAFNHTGKVMGIIDSPDWKAGIAVQLKVESERRNGGSLASVKAGHQKKAETASVTVRTTGLKASESTVTVQLASAQGLAERARKIGVEIAGRAERAKQAAEIAAEVNRAKELKAEAASYAVAEAVESGDVDVTEVDELNAELAAA